MLENFYTFITNIILSNIDKLDVEEKEKKQILIDVIKKLEAK